MIGDLPEGSIETKQGDVMKLNAPTQVVFVISVVLVLLALIGQFVPTAPVVAAYKFWLAIVGYVVLAAGCMMKGV